MVHFPAITITITQFVTADTFEMSGTPAGTRNVARIFMRRLGGLHNSAIGKHASYELSSDTTEWHSATSERTMGWLISELES